MHAEQRRYMLRQMREIIKWGRKIGLETSTAKGRERAAELWISHGNAADYRAKHEPPNSGWSWCTGVPDRMGDVDFSHACHMHDIRYAMRCRRWFADNRFHEDVYDAARAGGMGRVRAGIVAGMFWVGVRTLGGILSPLNRDKRQDKVIKEEAERK